MKYRFLFLNSVLVILLFICGCSNEKGSTTPEGMTTLPVKIKYAINPDSITFKHVMGKFIPVENQDFVSIDSMYASRTGMYLHKKTYSAFRAMHKAARADGIELTIRSATRNFFDQKRIWENKWNGVTLVESGQNLAETVQDPKERALVILKYSSMPGSSRHHWGTDIDINNFENSYFESGQGLLEYEWLQANAAFFGFCQPYTAKDDLRPNGYNEEKWHWSYLPVAVPLIRFAKARLTNDMITGFEGATTAAMIDIKSNYILGINKSCLEDEYR